MLKQHITSGKSADKTVIQARTNPATRPMSPKEARPQTCKNTKKALRIETASDKPFILTPLLLSRLSYFDEKQIDKYPCFSWPPPSSGSPIAADFLQSIVTLALNQRDCFAAHFMCAQKKLQKAVNSEGQSDILELLQRENQILRKKDEAWSREFTKVKHGL